MSTIIDSIEKEQLRSVPRFDAGDRVRVHFQVIEGSRKRTQVFEGVVIKRQGSGARETFTVRKQSFGVGVERTFPLHSPKIERLEVAAHGDVRRAKLYYLRDRVGKAARVAERRWGITEDVLAARTEGAIDSEGESQVEADVEVTEPAEAEQGTVEAASDGEQGAEEAAGSVTSDEPDGPEPSSAGAADDAEASETQGEAGGEEQVEAPGDGEAGAAGVAAPEGEAEQARAGGSEGDSTEDEASKQGG